MNDHVQIGTCGFRARKEDYAKRLFCVEIQHTFYQPPRVKTLERWRAEMPADFEFTLKAWEVIPAESSSPTFKRLRRKLTENEIKDAGAFKLTPIVREAWDVTLASAKALKSATVFFE